MTETCAIGRVPTAVQPANTERTPFVSVIVPVRNEAAFIEATVNQMLAQNYDPNRFEVLVADGDSTDATPEIVGKIAERHGNVRLLSNPRRWSSAGRNVGILAARGDYVVVVDGHCEVKNPEYLRNLVDAFERSGGDSLGRPQPLDVSEATSLQRAIACARSSRLGHNPASYIYSSEEGFVRPQSVAVAYRRSVFEKIGLFDENFDACEDVEFNHRLDQAGLSCFFTPRVGVRYHPRSTLGGLFRQLARYGRGRIRLLRKHPNTFSVPCLLPGAFLLGLIVGLPCAVLSSTLAAIYLGVLAAYGAAVGLGSLWACGKARDLSLLPWLPLVFAAIHFGAGVGLLRELVALGSAGHVAVPATSIQSFRVISYWNEGEYQIEEQTRNGLAFPPNNLAKGA